MCLKSLWCWLTSHLPVPSRRWEASGRCSTGRRCRGVDLRRCRAPEKSAVFPRGCPDSDWWSSHSWTSGSDDEKRVAERRSGWTWTGTPGLAPEPATSVGHPHCGRDKRDRWKMETDQTTWPSMGTPTKKRDNKPRGKHITSSAKLKT